MSRGTICTECSAPINTQVQASYEQKCYTNVFGDIIQRNHVVQTNMECVKLNSELSVKKSTNMCKGVYV